MDKNKKGLGRGLDALLSDDVTRDSLETFTLLRLAEIEPNQGQPRQHFDEPALLELADSIRIHGVITPLIVRKQFSGTYQIIAGERRWRAARMAGLTQLPAVIMDADDRKVAELALIENLQREDLNALEVSEGYRALMDDFGLTQEEVAQQVGRSRPAVANALRLLGLPDSVKSFVLCGELSEGHGRTLLALKSEEQQLAAAKHIVAAGQQAHENQDNKDRANAQNIGN